MMIFGWILQQSMPKHLPALLPKGKRIAAHASASNPEALPRLALCTGSCLMVFSSFHKSDFMVPMRIKRRGWFLCSPCSIGLERGGRYFIACSSHHCTSQISIADTQHVRLHGLPLIAFQGGISNEGNHGNDPCSILFC